MIPHDNYHQDFGAFFPPLEQMALGAKNYWLLIYEGQYRKLGFPQVALALYAKIDTPESILNIAKYGIISTQVEQSIDWEIDPDDEKSLDGMLQQVKKSVMFPQEAAKQAWNNAQAVGIDHNLVSKIEAEIASSSAISYLQVGNKEDALKQADRLSAFADNPVAQYTAAAVYASQGKKKEAIDRLDALYRLSQTDKTYLPDAQYFDSVRQEAIFQTLKIGGVISGAMADMSFAMLSEEQVSILIKKANISAWEGYKSFITSSLCDYVSLHLDFAATDNDPSHLRNATDAAEKAVDILGINGTTAELLGLVYNKANRHKDAADALLSQEHSLSSGGKFELAAALALCGDSQGAFSRLMEALYTNRELAQYMDMEPYTALRQLISRPEFAMRMPKMGVNMAYIDLN